MRPYKDPDLQGSWCVLTYSWTRLNTLMKWRNVCDELICLHDLLLQQSKWLYGSENHKPNSSRHLAQTVVSINWTLSLCLSSQLISSTKLQVYCLFKIIWHLTNTYSTKAGGSVWPWGSRGSGVSRDARLTISATGTRTSLHPPRETSNDFIMGSEGDASYQLSLRVCHLKPLGFVTLIIITHTEMMQHSTNL